MRMDLALQKAAGQVPRPDDVLSAAERLLRPTAPPGVPAMPPAAQGGQAAAPPDNRATLQACHAMLHRTLGLLG